MKSKPGSMAAKAAVAAAFALTSACSFRGNGTLPPAAVDRSPLLRAPAPALLFVSDPLANRVLAYQAAGHNQKPVATISQGIQGPAGLAVDGSENLYVANTTGNTVTEYSPNGGTPTATFSQRLTGPVDVAVDDAGTVYVANFNSFVAAVVEFAGGSGSPSLILSSPCSCYPIGLTLDNHGNLFVAYDDFYEQTQLYEYAPGSTSATAINVDFNQSRWEAAGLAFDGKSNLVVADATLPGVQVFANGRSNAAKVFGAHGKPRFVVFGPTEKDLFVSDTSGNAVEEYAYPTGRLMGRIATGLKSVYGVAVSPRAPL